MSEGNLTLAPRSDVKQYCHPAQADNKRQLLTSPVSTLIGDTTDQAR